MLALLASLVVGFAHADDATPPPATQGFKLGVVWGDFGADWKCRTEDSDLFCTRGLDASEMIVIATHKRTKDESLEAFEQHLKEPRSFTAADSKKVTSEVKSVQMVKVDGRKWIDGLHFQSEVPGFYTRYFATVTGTPKSGESIIVTFTFKKDRQALYEAKAPSMINGLKIAD